MTINDVIKKVSKKPLKDRITISINGLAFAYYDWKTKLENDDEIRITYGASVKDIRWYACIFKNNRLKWVNPMYFYYKYSTM